MLPEEWETEVDMLSVSISLTHAGAYQGLRVKRHQGREILSARRLRHQPIQIIQAGVRLP